MTSAWEKTDAPFTTTLWTLVSELHADAPSRHRAALEFIIRKYLPPVYAYLRRSGFDRENAAETTQSVFAEVVIQRDLFGRADQSQGRLRSLLLAALKNYLHDQHRRAVARGGTHKLSFDEVAHVEQGLSDRDGPEVSFDRTWALTVLNQAITRCERHFIDTGKSGHWRVFEARVLRPSASGCEAPPLAMLASPNGFKSAADAAAAVQVVKKRLDALLREVIAETTLTPEDSQAELQDLLTLLA